MTCPATVVRVPSRRDQQRPSEGLVEGSDPGTPTLVGATPWPAFLPVQEPVFQTVLVWEPDVPGCGLGWGQLTPPARLREACEQTCGRQTACGSGSVPSRWGPGSVQGMEVMRDKSVFLS